MTDTIRLSGKQLIAIRELPEHMRDSATAYVVEGQPPGDFLQAVLENNLNAAVGRADDANVHALRNWAIYLHHIPRGAWGSKAAVQDWIEIGGLAGIMRGAA